MGNGAKYRKGRVRRMSGVWGLNREILIILSYLRNALQNDVIYGSHILVTVHCGQISFI